MSGSQNVELLPIWNDRVSAAERLRELALLAELHPDRFQKLFVGWVGENESKAYHNERSLNFETSDLIGWLEIWKHEIIHRTNKSLEQ